MDDLETKDYWRGYHAAMNEMLKKAREAQDEADQMYHAARRGFFGGPREIHLDMMGRSMTARRMAIHAECKGMQALRKWRDPRMQGGDDPTDPYMLRPLG